MQNSQDTGPKFDQIYKSDENASATRSPPRLFTITEKAMRVASVKNKESKWTLLQSREIGLAPSRKIEMESFTSALNSDFYSSYKQKRCTLAQLVDLEEEMARDNFDYSVFVKKKDPAEWKVYRNEENEDLEKLEGFLRLKAEPVALWNERQAREKHSRCPKGEEAGLTALFHVMMSLGVTPKLSMIDAQNMSFHRKKEDTSPLPQYLYSCSRHGMNHEDLIRAMDVLSNGRIAGRFFEFYPQRRVDIRYWIAGWIKRGVVPLATLNYQKPVRGVSEEEMSLLPKEWHHHMIYAVSYDGIHLTNPITKMKADHFKTRLESESVVLIPKSEVLGRLQDGVDFDQLKSSPEWKQMNVLGQIEVVTREEERFHKFHIPCGMQYIAIPSAMLGGITLFTHKDSENYKAVMKSEEVFLKL